MPKLRTELSEQEIKMALAHWVKCGCPEVGNVSGVSVHYTNFDNSPDPRERSYFTASVEVPASPPET